MSAESNVLDTPPFPAMTWDDCEWWEGDITLIFGARAGLTVTPYDPAVSRLPSAAQSDALSYHLKNGQHVVDVVLDDLLRHYQQMRPKYIDFLGPDADRLMPALADAGSLKRLIDLRQVHIHPWQKSGIGYVGLQFGCTWDIEHGLGVLMHEDRIVEIGGADVSFAWAPQEADNQ